jgi:hypothetical protein
MKHNAGMINVCIHQVPEEAICAHPCLVCHPNTCVQRGTVCWRAMATGLRLQLQGALRLCLDIGAWQLLLNQVAAHLLSCLATHSDTSSPQTGAPPVLLA